MKLEKFHNLSSYLYKKIITRFRETNLNNYRSPKFLTFQLETLCVSFRSAINYTFRGKHFVFAYWVKLKLRT